MSQQQWDKGGWFDDPPPDTQARPKMGRGRGRGRAKKVPESSGSGSESPQLGRMYSDQGRGLYSDQHDNGSMRFVDTSAREPADTQVERKDRNRPSNSKRRPRREAMQVYVPRARRQQEHVVKGRAERVPGNQAEHQMTSGHDRLSGNQSEHRITSGHERVSGNQGEHVTVSIAGGEFDIDCSNSTGTGHQPKQREPHGVSAGREADNGNSTIIEKELERRRKERGYYQVSHMDEEISPGTWEEEERYYNQGGVYQSEKNTTQDSQGGSVGDSECRKKHETGAPSMVNDGDKQKHREQSGLEGDLRSHRHKHKKHRSKERGEIRGPSHEGEEEGQPKRHKHRRKKHKGERAEVTTGECGTQMDGVATGEGHAHNIEEASSGQSDRNIIEGFSTGEGHMCDIEGVSTGDSHTYRLNEVSTEEDRRGKPSVASVTTGEENKVVCHVTGICINVSNQSDDPLGTVDPGIHNTDQTLPQAARQSDICELNQGEPVYPSEMHVQKAQDSTQKPYKEEHVEGDTEEEEEKFYDCDAFEDAVTAGGKHQNLVHLSDVDSKLVNRLRSSVDTSNQGVTSHTTSLVTSCGDKERQSVLLGKCKGKNSNLDTNSSENHPNSVTEAVEVSCTKDTGKTISSDSSLEKRKELSDTSHTKSETGDVNPAALCSTTVESGAHASDVSKSHLKCNKGSENMELVTCESEGQSVHFRDSMVTKEKTDSIVVCSKENQMSDVKMDIEQQNSDVSQTVEKCENTSEVNSRSQCDEIRERTVGIMPVQASVDTQQAVSNLGDIDPQTDSKSNYCVAESVHISNCAGDSARQTRYQPWSEKITSHDREATEANGQSEAVAMATDEASLLSDTVVAISQAGTINEDSSGVTDTAAQGSQEPVAMVTEQEPSVMPRVTDTQIPAATAEEEEEEDSWDKMFDDDGEALDPKLMEELTVAVGKVKVTKPKLDYLDYQPKDPDIDYDDYSHLVEIYDFPTELVTRDLVVAFQEFKDKGFDIKWVDDNHAIGVFSSTIAAKSALSLKHPLMKVRPLDLATRQTKLKAKRCTEFLQPYKPRPETVASVARNMVAGALGLRSNIPKEKREQERRKLREARELKKNSRKQKEQAWDGSFGKCAMDDV